MRQNEFLVSLTLLALSFPFKAFSGFSWSQTREYSYPCSLETVLSVTNPHGSIRIQGGSFHQLKVQVIQTVMADTLLEAQKRFLEREHRFFISEHQMELVSQYSPHLEIAQILRQNSSQDQRVRQDFLIFAPSHLKLRVWGIHGDLSIKSWKGSLEVRSQTGKIQFREVHAKNIQAYCSHCSMDLKDVKASQIHLSTHEGLIHLHRILSSNLYLQLKEGGIQASQVEGNQFYFIEKGESLFSQVHGVIQLLSKKSQVVLRDFKGSFEGRLDEGTFKAQLSSWRMRNSFFLETDQADVTLQLKKGLRSTIDLSTVFGKIESQTQLPFSLHKTQSSEEHWVGEVGERGFLSFLTLLQQKILGFFGIRVTSQSGQIQISDIL